MTPSLFGKRDMKNNSLSRCIAVFAAGVTIFSCSLRENDIEVVINTDVFYASIEDGDLLTKTYIDYNYRVLWESEDTVSVFNRTDDNQKYIFSGSTGDKGGILNPVSDQQASSGSQIDRVFAVYPYSSANSVNASTILVVNYSDTQTWRRNSFGRKSNVMVAVSSDDNLQFKNLGGVLVLKLYGRQVNVNSLTIKGNNGESVAGSFNVAFDEQGIPSVSELEGITQLKMECPSPVPLGESVTDCNDFWIVLPPVHFSSGFTVTVNGDSGLYEVRTDKDIDIRRNHIVRMAPVNMSEKIVQAYLTSVEPVYPKGKSAFEFYTLSGSFGSATGTNVSKMDHESCTFIIRNKNCYNYNSYAAYRFFANGETRFKVLPENYDLNDANWSIKHYDSNQEPGCNTSLLDIQRTDDNQVDVKYTLTTQPSGNSGFIQLIAEDNYSHTERCSDLASLNTINLNSLSLAFSTSKYKGRQSPVVGYNDLLFEYAADAISHSPSFTVAYNGGAIPLDFIRIYLSSNGEAKVMSIEELKLLWPDLSLTFETIDCLRSSTVNYESKYCVISNEMLYPAFVNSNNQSVIINDENALLGTAAIGRTPVVLARITDNNNRTLAAGYFKIQFVRDSLHEDPVQPIPSGTVLDFMIKDFGTIPFSVTSVQKEIQKDQYELTFISETGLPYYSFIQGFSYESGKTYVKRNGSFIATDDYGSLDYIHDNGLYPWADKISLTISYEQWQNTGAGNDNTLYLHFMSLSNASIFVGLKYKTSEYPPLTFATKNPLFWYSDVEGGDSNTLRFSAPSPSHYGDNAGLNDDVTIFGMRLSDYWIGGRPSVNTSLPSASLSSISTRFKFSNNQPSINRKKIIASSDGRSLLYNGVVIATIEEEEYGNVLLNYNSTTRQLLSVFSAFSANPSSLAEMLYFNVDLYAYSSEIQAALPFGSETFHVRIIPPLYISSESASIQDGMPTGSYIPIGSLFRLVDSKNRQLFSEDGGVFSPCWFGTTVNLYGYYGVSIISLSLDRITTDLLGTNNQLLSDVLPSAFCGVVDVNTSNAVSGTVKLDISDVARLGSFQFLYINNMGSFGNYHLYVPAVVTHAWGELETTLVINVKGTD